MSFKIGDRVEKYTGAYNTFGEVRCAYITKAGAVRYVVEVEPQGFQMIWSSKELRLANKGDVKMNKEEALQMIDDHKNRLVDPTLLLKWTWLRVIVLSIPDDDWEKYLVRACEILQQ